MGACACVLVGGDRLCAQVSVHMCKGKSSFENRLCEPREEELNLIAATNNFPFLFYFLQLDSQNSLPPFQ